MTSQALHLGISRLAVALKVRIVYIGELIKGILVKLNCSNWGKVNYEVIGYCSKCVRGSSQTIKQKKGEKSVRH